METQVYHGTRYIDEVVGLRAKDQGRVYLQQDANWNVTAMTDLTGRVIERYWYTPYGELEAVVAAHPFDYDDDGDVDDDDYAVTTNGTCSGAAAATGDCRRMDANADGVVNDDDRTVIAAYIATLDSDTELQRIPASAYSRRGNVFAHQGLVLDPELASYQNRARQYAPKAKRFVQRDPLDDQWVDLRAIGMRRLWYSYAHCRPISLRDPSGWIVECSSGLECSKYYCTATAAAVTLCEGATPCACICTSISTDEVAGPIVKSCLLVHESEHAQNWDCSYNSGPSAGPLKKPRWLGGPSDECAAQQADSLCIDSLYLNCQNSSNPCGCLGALESFVDANDCMDEHGKCESGNLQPCSASDAAACNQAKESVTNKIQQAKQDMSCGS